MHGTHRDKRAENVLLIVLDTVRASSTSTAGRNLTPTIEQIGETGVELEQAITPAPWTLPAHASIYTGLYPTEHGATADSRWLSDSHDTLAEELRRNEFSTGVFTANVFLTDNFNMAQGFDEVSFIRGEQNRLFNDGLDPVKFLNEREHDEGFVRFREIAERLADGPTVKNLANAIYFKLVTAYRRRAGTTEPPSWDEQAVNRAREFISKSVADERRFFGVVNLIGAHAPWQFDRELLEDIEITPEDIASPDRWQEVADMSEAQWAYAAGNVSFDETARKILTHLYEAWIRRTDALAGQLIDYLEAEGVLDKTLVVVTADHGECIAREGVLGHNVTVDEEVAHVPLVASGPTVPDRAVSDPVSLRQLYGTIRSATGIDVSAKAVWEAPHEDIVLTETNGVDESTVIEQYRDVASTFGRRYAGVTTQGRAERRLDTGETFGDDGVLDIIDQFVNDLEPVVEDTSREELTEEVEERLQELGYKG